MLKTNESKLMTGIPISSRVHDDKIGLELCTQKKIGLEFQKRTALISGDN
jgi:hypothetical protein